MKCPHCGHVEDRVMDSRVAQEGRTIRRRRECLKCRKRFTTYEQIEESTPFVVKRDGRRELFDRRKMLAGIQRACEKRPVSVAQMEAIVEGIEKSIMESGLREIQALDLGERVMTAFA